MIREQTKLDVNEEMETLITAMKAVPPDSKAYRQMLDSYEILNRMMTEYKDPEEIEAEMEREAKKAKWEKFKVKVDWVLKGIGIVSGVGTTIFLAKKTYAEESDMKLGNKTVWNLIGKKFDFFKS